MIAIRVPRFQRFTLDVAEDGVEIAQVRGADPYLREEHIDRVVRVEVTTVAGRARAAARAGPVWTRGGVS